MSVNNSKDVLLAFKSDPFANHPLSGMCRQGGVIPQVSMKLQES